MRSRLLLPAGLVLATLCGVLGGCAKTQPPAPPIVVHISPRAAAAPSDPAQALGEIRFGVAGCTATVIGPRRADGKWDVLTASHCVEKVGQRGQMWLKDGRVLNLTVAAFTHGHDEGEPDCCWAVTDETFADLAFATITYDNPRPGTAVWLAGYGREHPAHKKFGTVVRGENEAGQLRFEILASPGDSGGGIFRVDTGELIGVVCCGMRKDGVGHLWGCSAEQARRLRPKN